MKTIFRFTLCLLVIALFVSCQPASTVPADEKLAIQPAEIVGTWKGTVEGEPGFLIIREDGTVTLAPNQDGISGNTHTYWFDGDKTVSMVFMLIEYPCNPSVRDLVNNTPVWLLP